MITSDLYQTILVDPLIHGADTLCIISGYASPAIVYQQLDTMRSRGVQARINLVIGMTGFEGISRRSHQQFLKLVNFDSGGMFTCRYVSQGRPVHSKVYTWLTRNNPSSSFIGSANYTQTGFFRTREIAVDCDPGSAFQYYQSLLPDCLDCTDPSVPHRIKLLDRELYIARALLVDNETVRSVVSSEVSGEKKVLSLLTRSNSVGDRSGLNWGQRPGRNPDQAYIPVPISVSRSGFFPTRGTHFTVITDNETTFDAVIAQDNGKAIETPSDNSILGRYFRARLGILPGQKVDLTHLLAYGRTDVTFIKLDDETYFMDFSV